MVKQLEVSLYRSAPSFESYSDISTLKHRLQQLAMEIARKTQQAKESSGRSSKSRSDRRDRLPSSSAAPQAPSISTQNHVMGGMRFHSTNERRGGDDGEDHISSQHGNPNDPEWKIRIRHKQQRLLLLHHSSKCPYDDGKCKVTPYCSEMKKLWKHMARCIDNECRVPHCFSSRSILSHYRKCKDPRCPACGPVRETVRKTLKSSSQRRPNGMPGEGPHSGGGHDSMNMGIGLGGLGNVELGQGDQPMNNSMIPMSRGNSGSDRNQVMLQEMQQQGMQEANSPMPWSGEVASMPYNAPLSGSNGGGRLSSQGGNDAFPESLVNSNGAQNGALGAQREGRDAESSKSKHKQQRLLLLRHASKCTAPSGSCTVTPHCAEMKVLWRHIANCKEPQCKIKHCMSSRYVLSHYRRCRDPYCDICAPVRETIKNGTATYIHDPTFNPTGENATPPPANTEGPQTKKQKTTHDSSTMDSMPPPQDRPAIPAAGISSSSDPHSASTSPHVPTSGEENRAKSKPDPTKSAGKGASSSSSSEDHSLLECFTTQQVKTHIESLKKTVQVPPAKLKLKCLEVLRGLQTHEHGWVFATPVDPVELGLADYFDIIKKPMDLGTIQKKLEAGSYHSFGEFKSDVRLTFENAMKYNEERTVVHEMAKELKKKFDVDYKKLIKQLEKEHQEDSKKAQACGLCGCEKLNFEPPVFFCNGLNCPSKRIRRNTHFYITSDKQYAWCNQCFNELGNEIDLGTSKLKKVELTKRKNDETHEESWVQCDDCERWIHQICGLYNTRQDKENKSAYSCPLCLYEKRKKDGDPKELPKAPSANDIPRTKLSDWLEKDVLRRVNDRLNEIAKEKSETENTSLEKAYKEVASGGPLIIRQVTSTDRKLEVRERMKARYAHKNYPEEFPYRCKCIVVFQNIDGVDVLLFALYVYEHGDDNPFPNKKTVYVSYLDSVHFMKPRKVRTFIYHEILISYLDYVRRKGYHQAFIWACPPLKGDDYIFYAKPEDQKTPKDVRLRQWYLDMLAECQRRDIVGKVSNMYDQYFANKKLDAASVPYFEGDYFPGEAENIIKLLEEGDGKRKSASGKKKKDSSKSQRLSSSGCEEGDSDDKAYKEGGRDPVMQKFCDAIQGMKESFIVAFLNCEGADPENLVVPKEIMEYREAKLKSIEGDNQRDDNCQTRKRDADGNELQKSEDQVDRKGRPIKVLDDDAEEIDCEFFNTRQCFLDLCRGNHYQFDELRRAKHTSMMVLWHLQNREAPKFVQQCFSCNREIVSGIRHHCNVCSDFDLCDECFRSPDANRGSCNHKLEVIKVDTSQSGSSGLTEEQRRERQRNIQLHITLIEHASRCVSSTCKSSNCQKMKSYLKHGETCKIKASGGCKICKRIWTLLRIHAQQCKNNNCPIPQCIAIKKRLRQLQQKQQAMDDRRRQEMNRHYRMGMMGDNN
eukprot:CCRYP_000634-RA/>CCRYP_000634-RA protein AED:0.01 eAED:0.01 QI:1424/1/1/1/0.66/0.5/4/88/1434